MIHTSDLRLNSSQGKRERSFRFAVLISMRLKKTGNSSIQLKIFGAVILLAALFCAPAKAGITEVAGDKRSQSRVVGDNFEALFLQNLYEQMQKSHGLSEPDPENPFAPSHAELVYRSMLNQELMKVLSARRPLGVSDLVVKQLDGRGRVRSGALVK